MKKSERPYLITLLLCLFLGILGIHRFYAGKAGTGLIMLVTCGGIGIWWILDFILILMGKFKDHAGRPIRN